MCLKRRWNVAFWLKLTVRATSAELPEWPQLRTSERECLESGSFRLDYPQVQT